MHDCMVFTCVNACHAFWVRARFLSLLGHFGDSYGGTLGYFVALFGHPFLGQFLRRLKRRDGSGRWGSRAVEGKGLRQRRGQ